MREMSRDELLAWTPDRYTVGGWCDARGQARASLLGADAFAAALQLQMAATPVQELAYLLEALRQLLPAYQGAAPLRLAAELEEALEVVSRMIGQDNNQGLVEWLLSCAMTVDLAQDIDALLLHMLAVLRHYAVLQGLPLAPSSGER